MVEAYKTGFCPQCGTQIMVQDVNGRWNSFKSNFRQTKIYFSDGHYVTTVICATCLGTPDNETILEALLHPESAAMSEKKKEFLKEKWSLKNGN